MVAGGKSTGVGTGVEGRESTDLHFAELHTLFPRVEFLLHLLDGDLVCRDGAQSTHDGTTTVNKQLFDRTHHFRRSSVNGLKNGPVSAVTKLLGDLVSVHLNTPLFARNGRPGLQTGAKFRVQINQVYEKESALRAA